VKPPKLVSASSDVVIEIAFVQELLPNKLEESPKSHMPPSLYFPAYELSVIALNLAP
jgi:hypothetical protein